MILSTGMANIDDVVVNMKLFQFITNSCYFTTQSYPTENKDINLNVIRLTKNVFSMCYWLLWTRKNI